MLIAELYRVAAEPLIRVLLAVRIFLASVRHWSLQYRQAVLDCTACPNKAARSSQGLRHGWCAGFQLVDGKERMIVVEGLADGAMQRMQGIALQALTGAMPQASGTCRRAVHWHKGLRSLLITIHVQ